MLSLRQKQILDAVDKINNGSKLIEDGEKLRAEGLIEFDMLTASNKTRKKESGGTNVSTKVSKLVPRIRRSKRTKNPVSEDFLQKVEEVIGRNEFASRQLVRTQLNIGWTTAKKAVDMLIKKKRVKQIKITKPGNKFPIPVLRLEQ